MDEHVRSAVIDLLESFTGVVQVNKNIYYLVFITLL